MSIIWFIWVILSDIDYYVNNHTIRKMICYVLRASSSPKRRVTDPKGRNVFETLYYFEHYTVKDVYGVLVAKDFFFFF
jgi:hypothetical protein